MEINPNYTPGSNIGAPAAGYLTSGDLNNYHNEVMGQGAPASETSALQQRYSDIMSRQNPNNAANLAAQEQLQNSPWASVYGFDDGGSMPDDGSGGGAGSSDLVALALASVDKALQYGRQKFGLGQSQQPNEAAPGGGYPQFRQQNEDVEDRRGQGMLPGQGALSNFEGNAYSLYSRGKNALGLGDEPDPNNSMANELGAQDAGKGAIPDEEEQGGE